MSPFLIGDTSSKDPFSIAMLVYQRVLLFGGWKNCTFFQLFTGMGGKGFLQRLKRQKTFFFSWQSSDWGGYLTEIFFSKLLGQERGWNVAIESSWWLKW